MDFARQRFTVEIRNPKGEKLLTKEFTADAFGGFDGSFELPSDAALGVYQVFIAQSRRRLVPGRGIQEARVRGEGRRPEKPVMLGEKVHGDDQGEVLLRRSPVAEAKVKYKITRTTADERWYPLARWDWLFGPGYWWFAADSSWYPGWSRLGHAPARALVVETAPSPPEVVAEAEVPIRPDGTVAVEIDTALAKAGPSRSGPPLRDHGRGHRPVAPHDRRHGDRAGRPQAVRASTPGSIAAITAPATRSRRASSAQTLDRKPVAGKGTLKLLKIAYDAEGKPVETPVESWDLALDADGQARQTIKAVGAGPVPPLGDDRRRPGALDRGRLPAHDHWARIRRRERSASTTSRSSPSAKSIGPARRSGS